MKQYSYIFYLLSVFGACSASDISAEISSTKEAVIGGKYNPDWESLSEYEVPEWFKDAKFGIWAHWVP